MGRPVAEDLKGRTFGMLRVVQRSPNSSYGALWYCRCRCGRLKEVRATALKNGNVKSCGCLMGRKYIG